MVRYVFRDGVADIRLNVIRIGNRVPLVRCRLFLLHETTVSLGAGQTAVMRTLMLQNHAEPFASIA